MFKAPAYADRFLCQQGNLPFLRYHSHAIRLRLVPRHTQVFGALVCYGHHGTYYSLILQLRAHEYDDTRTRRSAGGAVLV